jgi:predicted RNA binding protein YcfA (HicA-like mRNA interferase family)
MPKLPHISGKQLLALLVKLGYRVVRQRGSHIRLEKATAAGTHKLTVPNHAEIAAGTLSDILGKVAVWNQITKEQLIEML